MTVDQLIQGGLAGVVISLFWERGYPYVQGMLLKYYGVQLPDFHALAKNKKQILVLLTSILVAVIFNAATCAVDIEWLNTGWECLPDATIIEYAQQVIADIVVIALGASNMHVLTKSIHK